MPSIRFLITIAYLLMLSPWLVYYLVMSSPGAFVWLITGSVFAVAGVVLLPKAIHDWKSESDFSKRGY